MCEESWSNNMVLVIEGRALLVLPRTATHSNASSLHHCNLSFTNMLLQGRRARAE